MSGYYRLWIRWSNNEANTGPTTIHADEALDDGEVWVGWADIANSTSFRERERAKAAISSHYAKEPREVWQEAGSALRFFTAARESIMVVPTSSTEFALASLSEDVTETRRRTISGGGRVWARSVEVLERGLSRGEAPRRLRRLMSVPHTCLEIGKAKADVDSYLL